MLQNQTKGERRDNKRKRSKAKRVKHNYWKREQIQWISKKRIKYLQSKIKHVL